MRANRLLPFLLLLGFLFACEQTALVKDTSNAVLPEGEKRPVEVVLASPQGETQGPKDYQAITLVFNQPMRPLSGVDDAAASGLLTFTPPVMGKAYWKGTATLEFRPDKPLAFGTQYKVEVKEGLKSWAKTSLEKPFSFEFRTPGPRLVQSKPANKARHVDPGDTIFLLFDQPPHREKAKDSLVLYHTNTKNGKVERLDWALVEPQEGHRENFDSEDPKLANILAIKSEQLKPGVDYYVKVKQGFLGAEGTLGASKTDVLTFRTYEEFEWASKPSNPIEIRPEGSIDLHFTNPVKVSDVIKHLTFEPELEIPEHYEKSDHYRSYLYLYLKFKPRTKYKVTLSGDLEDKFGHKLGKEGSFVVKTGDFRPVLNAPEGIGVLESQGPKQIPVGAQNLDQLQGRWAVLNRSQLLAMLNHDGAFWGKGWKPPSGFSKPVKFDTKKMARNERHERPLDLSKATKSGFGYVFYEVTGSSKKENSNYRRRGLAQVTNLGITAKFSPENVVVMASQLDVGEPLSEVQIELTNKAGKSLWKGKTGEDGTVQAPGWKKLGLSSDWGAPQIMVFARKGKDETFVRSEGFGGLSPWMFDVSFNYSPPKVDYRGFGFTERGLYRAGESVHLKGTFREKVAGAWALPEVDSVKFKVTDSRDQKVTEGLLEVSEFGSFAHQLELSKQAPTGVYSVTYSLPPRSAKKAGSDYLFSTSFRVEAFRPAQFEVTVEPPKEPLVVGDKAKFSAKGWWLFGAPMRGEPVEWGARVEPYTSRPDDFPGYDFGPMFVDEEHRDEATNISSDKTVLNDEGLLDLELETKGINYRGDAMLTLEATVTSPTRQQLSGRAQVPLYRGEFRLGLKPASTFVPANEPVNISVVAITPEDVTTQGQELKLELIKREWNSVRKVDVDGRYRWVSEPKDEPAGEQTFRSAVKPVEVPITPPKPGFYVLRVSGKDGRGNQLESSSYLYAYGGGYVAWSRSDDDVVELVADKDKYQPGETAKILVKSPYEKAKALVTLERELILHRFVVELEGSADTIEIPLSSEHLPNVYVSVVLLQGRDAEAGFDPSGDDLGKPAFKIGYLDLPVAPAEKKLQVAVSSDKENYGPGDEVTLTVQTQNAAGDGVPAEVTVMVADLAVLNLISYLTPDYFETFYRSRPLSVWTSESRLDVIGQRSYGTKGESEGGGGGLETEYRKDFKFTAFWEPALQTDETGKAEVKFNLPQNLSTFRVMAVAHTKNSDFGSGESKLVVNKPLILKPSLPTFARVGDKFEAGVLAFNNSKQSIGVTLEMKVEGLETPKHVSSTVAVEPGQEAEILFPLVANKEGTAKLQFAATMGAETDGLEMEIPINLPMATEAVATSGKVTDKVAEEGIEVPKTSIPGTAKLFVSLSPSALSGLEQTIFTMLKYPYGCAEQRLSRLAPLLLAEDLLSSMEVEGFSSKQIRTKVNEAWTKLGEFQRSDGGFGVWVDSRYSNPYLTAQLLLMADRAKDAGYKLDKKMEQKARNYLGQFLNGKASFPYKLGERQELVVKSAAVAARARGGAKDPGRLSALFGKRAKMATVGKVYLLQAAVEMKHQRIKKTLITELSNALKVEAQTAHFEVDESLPWIYSSSIRDTGLILDAILEADPKFAVADRVTKWLVERRKPNGAWGSTQENTAVLMALTRYLRATEPEKPDYTARAVMADEELLKAVFASSSDKPLNKELDLESGKKAALKFVKEGPGTLFYSVRMSYAPSEPTLPRDRGFAVFKEYFEAESGSRVEQLEAGKNYRVRLSLVTPTDRHFVVLNDPVPAGVEVVQTTFATESQALARLLRQGGYQGGTFDHTETYDDRMLLFADYLSAGEHHFEYLVRGRLPGTYLLPATKAEEMYHPEIFGTGSSGTIEVR